MVNNFVFTTILFNILCTFIVDSKSAGRRNVVKFDSPEENRGKAPSSESQDYDTKTFLGEENPNCWVTLHARQHFEAMDQLDETYAAARQEFVDNVAPNKKEFDDKLLRDMLNTRGRVSQRTYGVDDMPAGLNLGGYCMVRMNKSLLFFHRMKLRNDTRFRINYLHTDLREMQIVAQLSLNDLHLVGTYERAITDNDPSVLIYAPTFGHVEILLENVEYKMEGRLRMLEDSLYIVVVKSEITFNDALLIYKNNASHYANPLKLKMHNLDGYTERMKTDLDKWLRDYFNEHLIFFTEVGNAASEKFREYEKKKTTALNNYVEDAIKVLKGKLHQVNASNVMLPSFSIYSVSGMELKLKDGVLRGLDTMHRRSVATGKKENDLRVVDAIVGFSSLKAIYKYSTFLPNGLPPVTGVMILTADDLFAHMSISLIKEPEAADLNFDFIQQMRPEALTVEGTANRLIGSFKHILEYHVVAIMTNTLIHNIKAMGTLTKCQPELFGYVDIDEPARKRSMHAKDGYGQNKTQRNPDYVVQKEDSIEVELPPNDKGESKKVHLAHVESLNITNLNKK